MHSVGTTHSLQTHSIRLSSGPQCFVAGQARLCDCGHARREKLRDIRVAVDRVEDAVGRHLDERGTDRVPRGLTRRFHNDLEQLKTNIQGTVSSTASTGVNALTVVFAQDTILADVGPASKTLCFQSRSYDSEQITTAMTKAVPSIASALVLQRGSKIVIPFGDDGTGAVRVGYGIITDLTTCPESGAVTVVTVRRLGADTPLLVTRVRSRAVHCHGALVVRCGFPLLPYHASHAGVFLCYHHRLVRTSGSRVVKTYRPFPASRWLFPLTNSPFANLRLARLRNMHSFLATGIWRRRSAASKLVAYHVMAFLEFDDAAALLEAATTKATTSSRFRNEDGSRIIKDLCRGLTRRAREKLLSLPGPPHLQTIPEALDDNRHNLRYVLSEVLQYRFTKMDNLNYCTTRPALEIIFKMCGRVTVYREPFLELYDGLYQNANMKYYASTRSVLDIAGTPTYYRALRDTRAAVRYVAARTRRMPCLSCGAAPRDRAGPCCNVCFWTRDMLDNRRVAALFTLLARGPKQATSSNELYQFIGGQLFATHVHRPAAKLIMQFCGP